MTNRIYAFDVLKFMLAIVIILFHLSWKLMPQGYLAVEIFFVISGFLMSLNYHKYQNGNILVLWKNRLYSYYAYYLIFLLLSFSFFIRPINLSDIINACFFLQFLGIGTRMVSNVLWFLGIYTYVYVIYLILIKNVKSEKLFTLLPICLVWIMVKMYHISPNQSIMWTFEEDYYILSLPFCFWRGFVGIGIGLCCGQLSKTKYSILLIFPSLLAIGLISGIGYIFTTNLGARYDYLISFISGILLIIIYNSNQAILIKFLNFLGKRFYYICSLSLPIYIFHVVVIDVLKKMNYSTNDYPPLKYALEVVVFASLMQFICNLSIKAIRKIKEHDYDQ